MASNNRAHSRARVAFSWENRPGVCKTAVNPPHRRRDVDDDLVQKQLRPPPCKPARKTSRKMQKEGGGVEDPFLVAYRECTTGDDKVEENKSAIGGWWNLFGNLSCKHLTAVRDANLISSSPVSNRTVKKSTWILGRSELEGT